ncbi:hypothetical protein BDA96_06G113200 [Sorghum bicolor]|uniref:Major facilitator superfamily (MFS) profile domain-containing protein n=2 Tax=Sorghum bicolor TaxID=4558 RepID=A0A921QQB3_SORBI|nr:sugar transport protein 5 [Sorghum bicolor]EES10920.1 hypothetical protein SORBI_3006G102400 [Sorghum bicolor]KAG0526068.1 hypothetical protein BDA96_06G113200 [Sorghum bicolor]|eukprot:XP_002446592.1 sugar transport protein 5 [Sorghum bicolor]
MAGGGGFAAAAERGHARDDDGYGGRGGVTVPVVVTCLMAASCGLIFGYDIGVSGGVTQMESFLMKFFPEVSSAMTKNAKHDAYCKYDDQRLTAFTSSLYIAAMVSSLVASRVTRTVGRSTVMLIGGVLFLAGSAINAGAVNVAMLIIGRMLLGFGVGFTTQAAPLYLAETSPARWRGAFTTAYNIFQVQGALAATVTNYFTNRIPGWGWRVSLGLAAVPAAVVVLGALLVPDTPSSLVLRGDTDSARASLQRLRGPGAETDAELKDIVRAVEDARRNDEGAYERLVRGKGYGHYLVMVVAIPSFFDLTGVIVMAVFSPVLFRTVGFSSQKAIFGSVVLSLVNLASSLLSSFVMDRAGRRFLFLAGGAAMMICQLAMSCILAGHLGKQNAATMPRDYAVAVLVLMCLYTFSFGVSWGPLKWVVPSEIYPVEIRSAAQALTVSIALCLSFAQTQVFVSLLCAMKHGIFLFYAGWVLAMTAFVAAFLPETKGVPLEAMRAVWAGHWYWRRFVRDAKQEVQVNCL